MKKQILTTTLVSALSVVSFAKGNGPVGSVDQKLKQIEVITCAEVSTGAKITTILYLEEAKDIVDGLDLGTTLKPTQNAIFGLDFRSNLTAGGDVLSSASEVAVERADGYVRVLKTPTGKLKFRYNEAFTRAEIENADAFISSEIAKNCDLTILKLM